MPDDLRAFAAHCRSMVTAKHRPDCQHPTRHGPKPGCRGCVTDGDRSMWVTMADEAEAWLRRTH